MTKSDVICEMARAYSEVSMRDPVSAFRKSEWKLGVHIIVSGHWGFSRCENERDGI